MQFSSYLQVIAATMGFFGVILTLLGMSCLKANRSQGLLARGWRELKLEQVKKLTMQRNLLFSGPTLVVLFILCLVVPWVFNLAGRQVLEGYYGIAVYAGVMVGMVVSFFVYGFTAAYNGHRMEKRMRKGSL